MNDMANETKTYSVIQRNLNSWMVTEQGNIHEIVNECGHKHKSVAAALKCKRTLTPNSEFDYFGMIEDSDGRAVDSDALYDAEQERRRIAA